MLLHLNKTWKNKNPNYYSPNFNPPPPERVTVTLDLDAGLAGMAEGTAAWQQEINNAVRFIMDMSSQPVPPIEAYENEPHFAEPEAGPDPARNADRIDNEFIPG
jgi:hypothetical protein